MRFLQIVLATISIGLVCCSKSKPTYCVVDTFVSNTTDSISGLEDKEESKEDIKSLSEFRSVTDTLNSDRDSLVHAYFFLYDITGDGKKDLWINSGSCEADKILMAFTIDNGKPRKIFEGDGGHSDYFIYDGNLVGVMCNTGAGVVITYKYDGKRVDDSMVEFSVWNDEHKAISKSAIANKKLDYWENNPDLYIQMKYLSAKE